MLASAGSFTCICMYTHISYMYMYCMNGLVEYERTYMYQLVIFTCFLSFFFSVYDMREAMGDDILGDDMYRHVTYGEGDTMPQAVDIDDSRSENVQRIKALILKMTSYKLEDRPTALEVYLQAYNVYAGRFPDENGNEKTTDVTRVIGDVL